MNAPAFTPDADIAAGIVAEAMTEVMTADCGYAAAVELGDALAEAFRDARSLTDTGHAVALELLPWLRPQLFPEPPRPVSPARIRALSASLAKLADELQAAGGVRQ